MENLASIGRARVALLANVPFRRLWISQFASVVLIYGLGLAGTALVEERTQSSAQTGLIIVSSILPAFLTSLVSGAIVDRWGRKRLLIVSHLTRGVVALVFWAGASFLSASALLLTIYGANLTLAVFSQFATPAELAMLPDLVEKPQLPAANSVLQMSTLAGEGLGIVLLAPLLIKAFGIPSVGLLGGGLCLLATVLVWALPADASIVGRASGRIGADLWADMREGWKTIVRDRILAVVAIQATVAAALLLILLSLVPGLLARHMGLTVADAPYVLLPGGLAFALGLYWVGRRGERLRPQRTITIGLLGLGLSTVLLGYLATEGGEVLVALPCILGVGLSLGGIIVPARVVLQRRPPRAMRGRVIAAQITLSNAAAVVPLLLGGTLADRWGIQPVMSGLGLVALATAVAGLFLLRAGGDPLHGGER